jgi:chemotaxis protein CheZ
MNPVLSRMALNRAEASTIMPVKRKTFRIEESLPVDTGATPPGGSMSVLRHEEVLTELKALRDLIERSTADPAPDAPLATAGLRTLRNETDAIHSAVNRTKLEIAALQSGPAGNARVARELDAVIADTEAATQSILAAAEEVNLLMQVLTVSRPDGPERQLAGDVRAQVTRIFEACNFQDLSGQRISKVLATLNFVEQHVARMMEVLGTDPALQIGATRSGEELVVSGPRLAGDTGHATQADIDKLFA